jgi:ppGpp synthetase/RelA/SpoT-type nucleotidyltranferase
VESNFRHLAEDLRREIEAILQRVGILCRVFGRGKEGRSLTNKMSKNPEKYKVDGKMIQDAIGVRVALYFAEDVEIVAALLSSHFALDSNSSTIDLPANDQFTVMRHNLIFKVPERYQADMSRYVGKLPVDITFEVQLRSILSEGWHEVDHDLRYKCKEDWIGQDDLSRALNGIMATLETAEWSMKRIFEDLAYRHYKQKKWAAMLHNTVRMRADSMLSETLIHFLDQNEAFAKEVLRISRKKVIRQFHALKPRLPVTLDNIVYVWNYIGPRNPDVLAFTPALVQEALDQNNRNVSADLE